LVEISKELKPDDTFNLLNTTSSRNKQASPARESHSIRRACRGWIRPSPSQSRRPSQLRRNSVSIWHPTPTNEMLHWVRAGMAGSGKRQLQEHESAITVNVELTEIYRVYNVIKVLPTGPALQTQSSCPNQPQSSIHHLAGCSQRSSA
jgi:hypothetical protein